MKLLNLACGCAAIIAVAAVWGATGRIQAKPTKVDSPAAETVVASLKNGGYVVYLRHARTDRSKPDQNHRDLSNCATQRNLNDQGRADAKTIGAAFTSNAIQVDRVYASPYCRAKDTAELAFGSYEVANGLKYLSGASVEEKPGIVVGTKNLLGQMPAAGKNIVLVSHTSNLKEAAGIWPKEPAVAVVFKPDGSGRFEAVGKIEPREWKNLVRGADGS